MLKVLLSFFFLSVLIFAETNTTKDINNSNDKNNTIAEKNIQKMIEKEKKIKEEQKFYMGDEYNLKEHEVDKKTLKKVPLIEPEYDFDITDLYAD